VETQELLNGFDDTRDTDWETYTCTLGKKNKKNKIKAAQRF
jgi:hypothetical protein